MSYIYIYTSSFFQKIFFFFIYIDSWDLDERAPLQRVSARHAAVCTSGFIYKGACSYPSRPAVHPHPGSDFIFNLATVSNNLNVTIIKQIKKATHSSKKKKKKQILNTICHIGLITVEKEKIILIMILLIFFLLFVYLLISLLTHIFCSVYYIIVLPFSHVFCLVWTWIYIDRNKYKIRSRLQHFFWNISVKNTKNLNIDYWLQMSQMSKRKSQNVTDFL